MWNTIKYGAKKLWDRRRRWLRERIEPQKSWGCAERMKLHPCVAHRGWSGKAPENTLAAFRQAMGEPAVRWVELDVHLSRDLVPVVIHDPTLKRTANGKGRVCDFTVRELSRLDAGSWFGSAFAGERIPTLDQVLALTTGRCRLNIEIKGEDTPPAQIVGQVLGALRRRQADNEVVVTSFRPSVLSEVRKQSATIRTGLIVEHNPPDLIDTLQSLGCSLLSIGFRHLTERLLRQAAEAGIDVMAWTVNEAADLSRLIRRPEPVMICTNHPDRWLSAVHRYGE